MQSLPSPASSPSLKPKTIAPGLSRKRQRSQSMQSDASSSSPKRSASECPSHDSGARSPSSDEVSTLSAFHRDQDIDKYMEEQDDAQNICDVAQATTFPTLNGVVSHVISPEDKLTLIKEQMSERMQVGDTWYLVSKQWYTRWQKVCKGEVDKEGPVMEKDLGPVDNSSLVDNNGKLVPSIHEVVDVEFVPRDAWSYFTTWYGESLHTLPRRVIATGFAQEPRLELFPPQFKVLRLSNDFESDHVAGSPYSIVSLSTQDSIRTLGRHLADVFSPKTEHRIWLVDIDEDPQGSEYPPSKLLAHGASMVVEDDLTIEQSTIGSGDLFVVEFKQGSDWIVDAAKVLERPLTTLQSDIPPPLFSRENDFFTRIQNTSSSPSSSSKITPFPPASNDIMSKFFPPSSPFLRSAGFGLSNSHSRTLEPGTIGLGNMGNTCFMNSALQCLAHTKELTDYFLTGVYQDELNRENPLGMHGAIAEAFGALLHRIWTPSSSSSAYSPREFKQQLQRFAPQFSGYQQHDSQELVAFLLDGLHEDLNRVLKKPYVEKPDWEGGGDREVVQLAQKSWEGYMRRNDSVIVDLFQGQYQSTLVCPECQKISITFDPFMYLTLPLPVQKKWRHVVFFVPWDLSKPHVKVPVEIGRDASFKDLRNLLGRWMGTQPDHLLMLEIFSHRFYKNLDDSVLCGEMSDNDVIVCFELPCHAQQSRSYRRQPDSPFVLPVFLCDLHPSRTNVSRGHSLFGYPFIVVADRHQATNVDALYDVIVERLQRWTDHARDLFTWEAGSGTLTNEGLTETTKLSPTILGTEAEDNGDGVLPHGNVAEGDIVDEKGVIVQENDAVMDVSIDDHPQRVGTKKGVFNLRLQSNYKEYGTTSNGYGPINQRFMSWAFREDDISQPVLLRENDAFFCEFDENMKAFYFGDERSRWEHARWDSWETFNHPEYEEAKKASTERRNKGISLQDCLDEFTKEEQLGEDDLWYCPRCKKHQQATKKFDLWKAPDILVVHLKRFSNSRAMRDKIDTFVDFPIEGLDLGDMVGESQIAKKLLSQGIDIEELGLTDHDEPLVYDLFGVDEHMGGLGGGHYRAYAYNHVTEQWYHFDDSYVSPARPEEAVNSNAYLLFYRRRTALPLGGKTFGKIEEARRKPARASPSPEPITVDPQLPTPPDERSYVIDRMSSVATLESRGVGLLRPSGSEGWPTPRSNLSNAGSSSSSPPRLDDIELPNFEDSQYEDSASLDPLMITSQQFDYPDPSSKASPTSSDEVEPDIDDDRDENSSFEDGLKDGGIDNVFPVPAKWSRLGSPAGSNNSDTDPFSDTNVQKGDDQRDSSDIPLQTIVNANE